MKPSLDDLFALDVYELATWARSAEAEIFKSDPMYLRGVIGHLKGKLVDQTENASAAAWLVYSESYRHLSEISFQVGLQSRPALAVDELNLMAALLSTRPPNDQIRLLSVTRAVAIFRESMPLALADLNEIDKDLRKLDLETIKKLRLAKSMVKPMIMLKRHVARPEDLLLLEAWWSALPQLP